MSVIIIPRKYYTQPQGRVEVDWANPITRALLVAATPFSDMATSPEVRYGREGAGARAGVLRAPPVRHGVANSTVFIRTQALLPDDDNWWNSGGYVYADTATPYANDLGLRVVAPRRYGHMIISARATDAVSYMAEMGVLGGDQTPGRVFTGAATVGPDLLVTAFGEGKNWGASTALQGQTYNAPSASLAGPIFGQLASAAGAMDFLSLVLRWGRVLADEEIFEVERNPWQLFRADPVRIYSLPSGPISISWSSLTASNITQTGARLTLGGITR